VFTVQVGHSFFDETDCAKQLVASLSELCANELVKLIPEDLL